MCNAYLLILLNFVPQNQESKPILDNELVVNQYNLIK